MHPEGLDPNVKIENFTQALIAWNTIATTSNNKSYNTSINNLINNSIQFNFEQPENNKLTVHIVRLPTQLNPEQP